MSDSNCVICLEQLAQPIAAVNPCGHCFHEQCFRDWDESKRRNGGRTRCPICNNHAVSLQRIFIHIPCDDNDDGTSLSSCDTTESGNDCTIADQESPDAEWVAKKRKGVLSTTTVVDLSDSPPAKSQKQNRYQGKHTSDVEKKLKLKTKRYKKRVKMLESQRKEFVEKERNLLVQCTEARENLKLISAEFQLMKQQIQSDKLELEHRRLEVVSLNAKRESTKAALKSCAKRVDSLESELEKLQQNYHHALCQAQAQGMAEAQLLQQQHQQLGDENNKLKQAMVMKDNRIQDLHRQMQRLQSLLQGQVDTTMNDLMSTNSRKRAALLGKSVREAEDSLLHQREQTARRPSSSTSQLPESVSRDAALTELQSRMKSKMSHQATRMSAAAGKKIALQDNSRHRDERHHHSQESLSQESVVAEHRSKKKKSSQDAGAAAERLRQSSLNVCRMPQSRLGFVAEPSNFGEPKKSSRDAHKRAKA